MALGVLEAARRLDVAVPDDLSVVGFDDALIAAIAAPPLTTVRQPLDLMGRTAFETLIRRIRTGRAEPLINLEPALVTRASTAKNNDEPHRKPEWGLEAR
jgi:LacI family transcriptional regulator